MRADGSPQAVSKLIWRDARRPEGPKGNRPERKLGIDQERDMSTEGAAQIQISKMINSLFAYLWSAALSALNISLPSIPA
jgi:hypothetical protein